MEFAIETPKVSDQYLIHSAYKNIDFYSAMQFLGPSSDPIEAVKSTTKGNNEKGRKSFDKSSSNPIGLRNTDCGVKDQIKNSSIESNQSNTRSIREFHQSERYWSTSKSQIKNLNSFINTPSHTLNVINYKTECSSNQVDSHETGQVPVLRSFRIILIKLTSEGKYSRRMILHHLVLMFERN